MNWTIRDDTWIKDNITSNGNKFLIGNGYMGIRGTLEEYDKDQCVAINLAGTYDKVGTAFREPLNAPNGLYTYIVIDGEAYIIQKNSPKEHHIELNYRYGIFKRETVFNTPKGKLTIQSRRFASSCNKHLIAMEYSIRADFNANITVVTGIDADVWELNGPHYDNIEMCHNRIGNELDYTHVDALTHEEKIHVSVFETIHFDCEYKEDVIIKEKSILRTVTFNAEPEVSYDIYKYISIYNSKEVKDYKSIGIHDINEAKTKGFKIVKEEHVNAWEGLWKNSEVIIEGDDEAYEALNYSLYHLHSIAPRHSTSQSIAARGLSGQTYKGAVFWDTEMFMLDFFLYTEPNVAKTLLKYRIDSLDGAKIKAKNYGYRGAFYPWESQEGGYDGCSDYNVIDVFTKRPMRTYFKDKQIHISSAIVYGIMSYTDFTKDTSLLYTGGYEVILECAIFYYDLLLKRVDGTYYELHDVIGPDEYHERVNNNGYTNRMAKYTFDSAIRILDYIDKTSKVYNKLNNEYDLDDLKVKFVDASNKIYLKKPDNITKVIEQFDGYMELEDVSVEEVKSRLLDEKEYWGGAYGVASHTQIIKQADVVTLCTLFPEDFDYETLEKNWDFYEPRTEHGSSLSACMYALLACKLGRADKAYTYFMKSALSDLNGGGKEWAGLLYIGGTHPASSGGAYMTAINGFGGVTIKDNKLTVTPNLPSHWKKLKFHINHLENIYCVTITKEFEIETKLNIEVVKE